MGSFLGHPRGQRQLQVVTLVAVVAVVTIPRALSVCQFLCDMFSTHVWFWRRTRWAQLCPFFSHIWCLKRESSHAQHMCIYIYLSINEAAGSISPIHVSIGCCLYSKCFGMTGKGLGNLQYIWVHTDTQKRHLTLTKHCKANYYFQWTCCSNNKWITL